MPTSVQGETATGQETALSSRSKGGCTALNVPITYMLLVDGSGYERWGVAGALAVDAIAGLLACLAFVLLIAGRARRRIPHRQMLGDTTP